MLSEPDQPHRGGPSLFHEPLVVTGLGALSAFGLGHDPLWRGLLSGEARFEPSSQHGHDCGPRRAARVAFHPEMHDRSRAFLLLPRVTQMALVAAQLAFRDAALPEPLPAPERVGVYFASSSGLLDDLARFERDLGRQGLTAAKPSAYQELTLGALAGHLSIQCGARGPVMPFAGGWSSGVVALHLAALDLAFGAVDIALVAAAESLGAGMHREACERGWLAPADTASSPFDAARSGVLLGEGAVAVILEPLASARARGARSYAALRAVGRGSSGDVGAFESSSGDGLRCAMEAASSGLSSAARVDHVCALGCGHPALDRAEAAALSRLFSGRGREVAIGAPSSMLGHAGSVSGLYNLVAAALAVHTGKVPPIAGHHAGDADLDLDLDLVIGRPREKRVRAALANAFSQGGDYLSLLIEEVPAG